MVDFLKVIDFKSDLEAEPKLEPHLRKAANELSEKTKTNDEYKQPFFDQELNNMIVIVGLPETKGDITEKLKAALEKLLTARKLPVFSKLSFGGSAASTNGTAVLEFADPETAKNVAKAFDNFQLDNKHKLNALTFSEFDQILNTKDKYEVPKILTKQELQAWLLDPRNRDQFMLRSSSKIKLNWFDHVERKTEDVLAKDISITANNDCEWSKSGSYLVIYQEDGFSIYGGNTFDLVARFDHKGVKNVEFSPDEKYVLSFNGTVLEAPNSENYIVWNVALREKIREFKAEQNEGWGAFKWNFDGGYIAKVGKDLLSIYKLPGMTLLEDPNTGKGASTRLPNIQSFSWSPKKNYICVVAYTLDTTKTTKANMNSTVHIIQVPERIDIKWKTIPWFMVSAEIYWDESGTKLILVLGRQAAKKTTSIVVQVGDLSQKILSVDDREFSDVRRVNVDDNGARLSVIHNPPQGVTSGTIKFSVEMLKIEADKAKMFVDLTQLHDKTLSHVLWSSNGNFFALVNTDKASANIGFLEFGAIKKNNQLEIFKSLKVPYMNFAQWDPSGRCLLTCTETGHFSVWNGLGEQLFKDSALDLNQITWRPRPKIFIAEDKEKTIVSKMKELEAKYEKEDDMIQNKKKYEDLKIRKEKKQAFEEYMIAKRKEWFEAKKERRELLGFDEENLDELEYEEIIEEEFVIDSREAGK
jgi:translation initiation factor 3 subunit B